MKPAAPLGLIRPLRLGLGRAGRPWRGGPLVPMIWRRRTPVRAAQAGPAPAPSFFASTCVFNLSLAWPAGTATRVASLRAQLTAPIGRGPTAGRPGTPVERQWPRLEKTVLSLIRRTEAAIAVGGSVEAPAPSALAPRSRRLPARGGAAIAAMSPRSLPAPRAAGIRLRARQPAMSLVAEPNVRAEAAARSSSRAPAALVWRSEDARGAAAAALPALPGASARRGVELVWRRPAPSEAGSERGAAHEMVLPRAPAAPAAWRDEVPQAAATRPATPAPIPPVEMNRLVDEVVRRLDRIGRDERLRRGI